MFKSYFALIAILVVSMDVPALAQQTMINGGSWTVGNVPKYIGQSSSQPVLSDSGLTPGSSDTYDVADLPTCSSSNKGQLFTVLDAASPTYGATLTGSGSTVALALCDGSAWKAH